MRTSITLGCALVLWGLCGFPSSSRAERWEFLAKVPGSRYTYDLTTTPKAVYMVLGDSLGNTMGLYRYNRLAPTAKFELVAKPAEPLFGVYVGGENDEHIWLGSQGYPTHEDYLWYSSDGGETWVLKGSGALGQYFALTGSRDGRQIYAASLDVLCFQSSSDYGETWTWWGDCSNSLFGTMAMETDYFNPDHAYGLLMDWSGGGLFVVETSNSGQIWVVVFEDFGAASYGGLYPSPFNSGDLSIINNGGDVFARIDGDWIPEGHISFNPAYGIAQPIWDGGALWIAGRGPGTRINVGRNDGGGWVQWNQGLPEVHLDPGEFNNLKARLWACPLNGDVFLTLPDHGLWVYQSPASAAPELELSANSPWIRIYPNPSRGLVHLALGNLGLDLYRLEIYDVRGRSVRALHEGSLQGSSTWEWNGRDASERALPSGVYLLRLTDATGRSQLSKKVLLLNR